MTLSPPEIAAELQTAENAVRYHVRVLELTGLLEVAGEEITDTSYERFYRLVRRRPGDFAA